MMGSKTGLYQAVKPALEAAFNQGFVHESWLLPAVILCGHCPCTLHWKLASFSVSFDACAAYAGTAKALSNGHSQGSALLTTQV